jgi:hypothetical protein
MRLITLNGQFWVLNTEGKIPLCGGTPVPKLIDNPTPRTVDWAVAMQ